MMREAVSLAAGRLLSVIALLVTVMVIPWAAFDPINVPKLFILTVGGFTAIGLLLANAAELRKRHNRLILLFGLAFFFDLTVVLLVSGTNFYQELYGTFGRATGYIAYVGLTALLVLAAVTASTLALRRFTYSLLIAGAVSTLYGLIQIMDLDPIKWVNDYSPIIGFLGNPNFQSSFIGFSGVATFSMMLSKNAKNTWRSFYLFLLMINIYVIKETGSQQGFLVLLAGISIVFMIWIKSSKFKIFTLPTLLVSFLGLILVTLGSLNLGPLSSLLYKASVTYRGDYWRAGWAMTLDHPFFGVGLDSYGDWYRRARTIEATLRRGPDVTSNAAHNVMLDLSSNGGLPLLAIYLFLIFLVVSSAIKVLKRSLEFDPFFSGLLATWLVYQAQSIISLNQIGLAVWGWIISGLIIGYETSTRENERDQLQAKPKGKNSRATGKLKIMSATRLMPIGGLLIGICVALPPVQLTIAHKSAIESMKSEPIEELTKKWPGDSFINAQVVALLANSNLNAEALVITKESLKKYPDSYDLWRDLATLPNSTKTDRAKALAQMKRLDPNNPNLK